NAGKSLKMVELGQNAVDLAIERMNENFQITKEVGNSVNDLGEMVAKVESIVDVITSITEQTNLLALNAAIEAARAGEAGKGFAVVSEEIRKLAEGSSSAAKEITTIIRETTEKNKQASENMALSRITVDAQVTAVNNTKEAFDKIKLSVEDIVKGSQQSSEMLKDIDSRSKEIANHTQDMAAVAQESAASSQEISASGQEQLASIEMIANSASGLSKMAEELTKEVKKFKL
ncbi:MAG: methyl-accepting chemotaxis protein, partial [Bacillota bacterium]|nr:methyl-accepting chemotaxis protein [Bacillota bacterium]